MPIPPPAAATAAAEQTAALKAAKEQAEARKAASDAEKSAAEAAQAAAKAKLGDITASGTSGAVELGAGAGSAETLLLGAVAVRRIAQKMARAVALQRPQGVQELLLCTSATVPDFQALQVYTLQRGALQQAMEAARRTLPAVPSRSAGGLRSLGAGLTAGVGLDALGKLLSYVKTDYKFQNIDVAATDAMLLAALAGELRAAELTVHVPSVYAPPPPAAVLADLAQSLNWPDEARRHLQVQQDALAALADAPAQSAAAKDAVAQWRALSERLDAWMAQLGTADDQGVLPMTEVLRQAAWRARLDNGAALLVLQLHKVAGTAYAKKNLWSAIFSNPFHVMGGAVATLTAYDGKTGAVFCSTLEAVHGGYHSVSDVRWVVNNERWGLGR